MAFLVIFFIFNLIKISTTDGLVGYLCGRGANNVTTVSTAQIGSCEVIGEEPNTTEVYIQLLQKDEYQPTDVIGCKISIEQSIRYCGMHSHISTVHGGESHIDRVVSRDLCVDMVKYGQYKFDEFVIRELIVNATNHRTITLAGTLTDNGECTGTTFIQEEHEYKNVFVIVKLEISIFQYSASYQKATDQLILPTTTVCPYHKGTCVDIGKTYYFWTAICPNSCKFEDYSILYEGISTKVSDNTTSPTIYFANTTGIQFGLAKTGSLQLCGFTIFSTEHPKFFIFETSSHIGFTTKTNHDVRNILFSAYFNTKIAYFARHVKTQFQSLYKDSLYHRCMLSRQIIINSISQLKNQPDMFALAVMKKPGFTAVAAGEVAHIIQCQPVECKIRPSEFCSQELPVTCNNQTMFLKPNTKILVPLGIPRDCNEVLPTMFQAGNIWVQVNPNVSVTQPPKIIQPMETPTWNYQEIKDFITSGVYPYDDIKKFDDHLIFPLKREALLESVARRLSSLSHPIENGNFKNLFDEETIEKLSRSYLDKLFTGFLKFGNFCAGILGIIFIFQMLKFVLDVIIHGYALYSIYGWSFRLLGALFNSITTLLLHNSNSRTYSPTTDHRISRVNDQSSPTPAPRQHRLLSTTDQPLQPIRRRERSVEELERQLLSHRNANNN